MTLDNSPIEALRNPRTGKLFIALEHEVAPGKVRVINPDGNILDVSAVIFDMDDPQLVQPQDVSSSFSDKQISAYQTYQREQTERVKNIERNRSHVRAPDSRDTVRSAPPRTREAKAKSSSRSARRVEWESDVLVFYRHYVEPLRDQDIMVIRVTGTGVLEMTKSQFLRVFNFVVMSHEYRANGSYRFETMPEDAKQFLRP